jgi:preflagellin peptidase FlaK
MIEISLYLNIIRLFIGFIILSYASFSDLKTRKASNFLWIIMSFSGVFLLFIEFLFIGFDNNLFLLLIPVMIVVFYLLFQLLPFFGGADVKALMSIAILAPFQPIFLIFPFVYSYLPFAWIVLSNSVFIYLAIPISLFFYNLYKKNLDFPYCFLGYKIYIDKAKDKFVWPLEDIVDGKRKISYFSMNKNNNFIYSKFLEKKINIIWVTPKIPFMIPLLIGYIISFIIGDILFFIMSLVL